MTGINSYSINAADNVLSHTGINWDEGMPPGQVNNSARQNMADLRAAFNDLMWFQYGKGDMAYSPAYGSGTSFTIAGADVTGVYQVGRRVKAVGSSTGTIYGAISSRSFSTNTTVNVTWDSGSLTNEALTIYLSQVSVTGAPVGGAAIKGIDNGSWSGTALAVANGGTGSTTAADARTALSVPSTSGSGASGTWGISISGTAATATSANALNSSNSYTGADFTITSDDRLKNRAGRIENALGKIEQLTGFYYTFNALADDLRSARPGRQVGVSAQEVQKILPEAVQPWGNHPDYLTVAYDRLIPLLVEGLKELHAEMRALKGRA